ncbi:MAG: hypothetical protein WA997_17575 [Anaerolineales bacterium]
MKIKIVLLACLIVVIFSLIMFEAGFAEPPPMPSSYYGTVKANGSNVPLTTTASAWIDGVKYAETSVIVFNADTVYNLDVPGDILSTAEIEGGKPGDLITFSINNDFANQTGVWQSGTNTELNLSIIQPNGSFKLYLPNLFK